MEHDADIERLRSEIAQENQMKEMLEQSALELGATVQDLKDKLESIENEEEEDEWKSRHEDQIEMNVQLEEQIIMLQDKMKELKGQLINAGIKESGNMVDIDDLNEVELRQIIKQLEREKMDLEGQRGDLGWKLDQESKRLNKISEEKYQGRLELNLINSNMAMKQKQDRTFKPQFSHQKASSNSKLDRQYVNKTNLKGRVYGIPDNRRIIDPSKGPVKKTVAVKRLPKIERSSGSAQSSPGPVKQLSPVSSRGYNSAER